jgi:hypothetical protein
MSVFSDTTPSDDVLHRLRTLKQLVLEYPGIFSSVHKVRWRIRQLKADNGDDLRVFGVYRNTATGKILIDPQVFLKDIVN